MIEIDGRTKRYGDKTAVDRLSFESSAESSQLRALS